MSDKEKTSAETKAAEAAQQGGTENKDQTTVDLSAYLESNNSAQPVRTFAIEENQRNTEENPFREATSTFPTLVRRVNSEELLPRPFTSTTQMICASYLSMLCCLCFASFAVKHAFDAKIKRNAGNYTTAIEKAKRSCFHLKLALGMGIVFWIIGIINIALFFTGYHDD